MVILMRLLSWSGLLMSLGLLLGCYPKGDVTRPVPTTLIPAPQQPATRLVVVLPGRADDLKAIGKSGMAEAIQSAWPDADVMLAGLSMGFYMQGRAPERLHDEVILPARNKHGYRQVWIAGASLGGMGSLLYDRAYPGDADGLVLLAPYLGDKTLLQEIREAGGIAHWNAGDTPVAIDGDNFQRELWRHLQGWSRNPDKARNVWMAYGDRDKLGEADALLAPLLPQGHVLVRPGGHDWSVWSPATGEILRAAEPERTR